MARLKRILRHPSAAVVLLMLLGVSVWSLPKERNGGSAIGSFMGSFYLAHPTGPRVITDAYIIREPGGLVLRDPNVESMDAITKILDARPEDVLIPMYQALEGPKGLFAPTMYVRRSSLRITPWSNLAHFTESELMEARNKYLDWFVDPAGGGWNPEVGRRFRTSDVVATSKPLWLGHLHNGLAAMALVGLVYSLCWNLPPSRWRARRRAQRLSQGLCPRCRYPIHSLDTARCPECGEPFTATPALSPPRSPA